MNNARRNALTPEALGMVDAIARSGSFAAAARELGKVPSALTYSVRQLEDALDVLLFDRSSRQAKLTAAGEELLEHGRRVLGEVDALANRVQRVATGWEASLTIAADGVVSRLTLFELVESFYAERGIGASTQLRLRTEVLTGVWEALVTGHADLAIGLTGDTGAHVGIEVRPLGEVPFVFAVAPHHPLAHGPNRWPTKRSSATARLRWPIRRNAWPRPPTTCSAGKTCSPSTSMQAKIEAQVRCLGCGFIPEPLARTHIRNGVLVVRRVQRGDPNVRMSYAWRADAVGQPHKAPQGLALQWWLRQLDSGADTPGLARSPPPHGGRRGLGAEPHDMTSYIGRFAPTPSGPLHEGSLVAALASWLDARAHGGRWLVRIEDLDTPRNEDGADQIILGQLAICGLVGDEEPLIQSHRIAAYEEALLQIADAGQVYPCGCSRREVEQVLITLGYLQDRDEERVYPGTCRGGLRGKPARAMRVLTTLGGEDITIRWNDRRLGRQRQNLTREVGDFIVKRADGVFAYQLAVVVDDAHQGITHVVRGEDLADNTARQIHLQRLMGLPEPQYLHTPLVMGIDGHKLSKQNGAASLDVSDPVAALQQAARVLELPRIEALSVSEWLDRGHPLRGPHAGSPDARAVDAAHAVRADCG